MGDRGRALCVSVHKQARNDVDAQSRMIVLKAKEETMQ
jgi:hypothetical protein